jgi:hypothetical protein
MYGTVAHLKVKPGQEEKLLVLLQEWDRDRKPKVKGAVGGYVYKLEGRPNEYILVVLFQDRDSYVTNAEDPEQDRWYRRFRELLEVDPLWHDGEVVYSAL